jgi:hypothetical protein
MGVAFRSIRMVMVHTIHTVPLGQATELERVVEGIGRIESKMDEFERVQTEIHTSIDS